MTGAHDWALLVYNGHQQYFSFARWWSFLKSKVIFTISHCCHLALDMSCSPIKWTPFQSHLGIVLVFICMSSRSKMNMQSKFSPIFIVLMTISTKHQTANGNFYFGSHSLFVYNFLFEYLLIDFAVNQHCVLFFLLFQDIANPTSMRVVQEYMWPL